MGNNCNLADNKTDPAEGRSRRISSASDSIPTPTPAPITNRPANHPSYSFSRSSRSTTRTVRPSANEKPRSQTSSRSVSPAKISIAKPKASAVFQNTAIAGPSSSKTLTKPPSPLAPFNILSQSVRPATSDITASLAAGVIVQPPVTPVSPTPTIASSQHAESSPMSKPVMHTTGFDTIVEGEEADLPINFRGNATAFKESLMACLLEEYSGGLDGNVLSTETAVTILVTMLDLDEDTIERVEDPNRGMTKYKLSKDLLNNLCKTTIELQLFIERASALLEEREVHFTVDPKDTLLHILRGTTSLPQLNVAWKTIQKCLELGHKTLMKYQQQYQLSPQEDLLLSPISTVPELHNELRNYSSADQRLRHLYQKFPHHRSQLNEDAELALEQGRSWVDVIPLPDTLKNVFTSEREVPKKKQDSHGTKGKHKEREHDPNDDKVEPRPSDRIWLGAETPFKGPNKWFGGGRLKSRESMGGQSTLRATRLSQNVLFGLATPQLPIWATDSIDISSTSKQPRSSKALDQTKKWANHDLPPHLSVTTGLEQTRNTNASRKSTRRDPPDDDGDEDGDPSDHGCRKPPKSHKSSSDSEFSSRHGRRRRGGPPSEPSDRSDSDDSDSSSDESEPGKRRRKGLKSVIPYGRIKPTIKTELKQEQLPRWDGNPNTAMKYFLRIQQLAALEGDLPQALGYWLWMNLEDGSDIKDWFTTPILKIGSPLLPLKSRLT